MVGQIITPTFVGVWSLGNNLYVCDTARRNQSAAATAAADALIVCCYTAATAELLPFVFVRSAVRGVLNANNNNTYRPCFVLQTKLCSYDTPWQYGHFSGASAYFYYISHATEASIMQVGQI